MVVIEDWHLNRCINCKEIAFAMNEVKQNYLINANLRASTEDIEKIKASSVYSNVFRVAMVQAEFMDMHGNNKPTCKDFFKFYYMTSEFWIYITDIDKPRIKNLQEQLHAAIQNETAAVEEKIRLFTEQQYAMLKMQRHRAEQEFHTLSSVINCVPEYIISIQGGGDVEESNQDSSDAINKSLMETPPATPDNTPMSIGNSPPIGVSTEIFRQQKVTPNKGKSVSIFF